MKLKIINWNAIPGYDNQGYYFNIQTVEEAKEIARHWITQNKVSHYTVIVYDTDRKKVSQRDNIYFKFTKLH
jgi:hypothetical protein